MPDVTLVVRDVTNTEEAERLERALKRLEFVNEANADPEKGLVAVSYEGGEAGFGQIEATVKEAGYEFEPSPGARRVEE